MKNVRVFGFLTAVTVAIWGWNVIHPDPIQVAKQSSENARIVFRD